MNDILIYVVINGAMYYLVTAGLSLSYGVQGILDIGNTGYMILGCYFFVSLHDRGVSPLLGLPLVFVALFVIGLLVHLILLSPLRGRGHMDVSLSLFGLLLALETLYLVVWGANPQRVPLGFWDGSVTVLGTGIGGQRLIAPIVAGVAFLLITLVMKGTAAGKIVRGVYSNPEAAQLSGISLGLVANIVYASSAALTAFAAFVCCTVYGFEPSSVIPWFLIGFTVIVLAGKGSLFGVVIAAVILATAEAVTARYFAFAWVSLVSAFTIVAVLIIRPTGLLGRRRVRSFAHEGSEF